MILRTLLNKLPLRAYVTGVETFVPVCQCRFLASSAPLQGRMVNKIRSDDYSTSVDFSDNNSNESAISTVSAQLQSQSPGRLFAVVRFGAIQRKVTVEDIITVKGHIDADIGQRIRLHKPLLVGGKDFTLVGRPVLGQDVAKIEATVIEKTLTHIDVHYWYMPRDRPSRKTKLSRNRLTYLRIDKIEVNPYSLDDGTPS